MVYLKDSLIIRSFFFLFFQNMALLQRFVAITIVVGVENLTALFLGECKLVFCSVLQHVYVGRIYSSIAQNLKFDWSVQVTWGAGLLGNQICLCKLKFAGTAKPNLTNTLAIIFSYPRQSM